MNEIVVAENNLPAQSLDLGRALERQRNWEASAGQNIPGPVTTAIRDEARAVLATLESSMAPAPDDLVKKWLVKLGILTAGNVGEQDAETKIKAYAFMLSSPSKCYTAATLKTAARLFKFFPSYSEIAGFLDGECIDERNQLRRLKRISQGPVDDTTPATPEEIKETGRKLKQLSKSLGGNGGEQKEFVPKYRPKKPSAEQLAAKDMTPEQARAYWENRLEAEAGV